MGKSDVDNLPERIEMAEKDQPKLFFIDSIAPPQKDPPDDCSPTTTNKLPPGVELLANQVAGHMHNEKTFGMMKYNGAVLKPITKPANGQREIDFYEELEKTRDDSILELRAFAPKYYGTKTVPLNGKGVKCIVLEDLTKHFKEPCIMDIKIGKRTWDPLATYKKIVSEDNKYQHTKRDLGISIPGFLVHKISSGRVCRYGKEYGKKLNSETVRDALRIFLNADSGLSRSLLLQFLVDLWRILHWARKQRRIRLFCSSLLLIYDARRLKQHSTNNNVGLPRNDFSSCSIASMTRSAHLYKPLSLMKLNDDCAFTGFSGQFTKEGPILSAAPPSKLAHFASVNTTNTNSQQPRQKHVGKLQRVHSFQNNYDKDLQKMRRDYMYILDDLVDDDRSEMWATVKMIDFAHAFPAEHCEADKNYIEGVENLVKIFEEFLSETTS